MKNQPAEGKRSRMAARKARRAAHKRRIPAARITVTFRHVAPTDAIRLYAERKLAHIARFLKRACDVHLILSVDKYRQAGEVTLKSGHLALTAQEQTKDLYSVIDLLTDKLERQLRSQLGKSSTRRTRASSTGEILAASEER
jgi:putative sigma-54 modulation protein